LDFPQPESCFGSDPGFEPAYSAGQEAAAHPALLLDFLRNTFCEALQMSDTGHRNFIGPWWILAAELNVRATVKMENQIENQRLLQILRNEVAFFDAGGYGRPFRSNWRPTLLLRDSPACINYRDSGRQNSCHECPLFSLVAAGQQDRLIPCHYIPLNSQGETITALYARGPQELLDQLYRNWLQEKIQDLTTS
jgi:hypothetical protein